jgi:hypothetical protein
MKNILDELEAEDLATPVLFKRRSVYRPKDKFRSKLSNIKEELSAEARTSKVFDSSKNQSLLEESKQQNSPKCSKFQVFQNFIGIQTNQFHLESEINTSKFNSFENNKLNLSCRSMAKESEDSNQFLDFS